MLISFIIPTRNRPDQLAHTVEKLRALLPDLERHGADAELIVADNASDQPVTLPAFIGPMRTRIIRMLANRGAAARNAAAEMARGRWLVMLDDDSHPANADFIHELRAAPDDAAAIAAEILLPDGRHEAGGLPEVFTGCGVALRRDIFLTLGGYDAAFNYYAEEYDLAARIILGGMRTITTRAFKVMHRKVAEGRDMNRILRRLVRNNGWVALRYAPDAHRSAALAETVTRYATIARLENATDGYDRGLRELHETSDRQPRREMTQTQWDRFTGQAHARAWLTDRLRGVQRVAIVEPGKNDWAVRQAIEAMGIEITPAPDTTGAQALVIGTLSPGPMLDAAERTLAAEAAAGSSPRPVITPWRLAESMAAQGSQNHQKTVHAAA